MKPTASAPIDAKISTRGGPIRWLVIGGFFLIAAITLGTTIMAGNFRERALSSAESQLENNVLPMARHFDQQLEDFMGIQRDVVAQIERSGVASKVFDRGSGHLGSAAAVGFGISGWDLPFQVFPQTSQRAERPGAVRPDQPVRALRHRVADHDPKAARSGCKWRPQRGSLRGASWPTGRARPRRAHFGTCRTGRVDSPVGRPRAPTAATASAGLAGPATAPTRPRRRLDSWSRSQIV